MDKASTVSSDWFSAAHLNKTIIINITQHHSKIIIVIYKIMTLEELMEHLFISLVLPSRARQTFKRGTG